MAVGGLLALSLCLALVPSRDALAQDERATFELTVEITWSAEAAPLDFPATAHMSRLIGVMHNSRYVLFRDGDTASSGLELLAENGRATILEAEFAEAMRRGRLGSRFEEPGLPRVPASFATTIETTKDHPLLSFVTMIAPSPDWFAGAADIALMSGGDWVEELEVPIWAWDAGTDSGQTYEAANADRQPRESIRLLATPHFLARDGLVPMGRAVLRRIGTP